MLARALGPLAWRSLARPLVLPDGVPVVTVGGATLGGSGKTRVALACVRALGRRAFLVGHAYRARVDAPRLVAPNDPLGLVGDEALVCARAGVNVVVGPTRQAALDHAVALGAQVVVVDGPLTTRPVRPALAILAVDAAAPWGSGEVVPAGDLRAAKEALVAAADVVVEVDAAPSKAVHDLLAGARFALFSAMARSDRLESALSSVPSAVVRAPDHGPLDERVLREIREVEARDPPLDLWLATPKCAIHLDPAATLPVVVLDEAVALDHALLTRLQALSHMRGLTGSNGEE
jgi:tetraacyldisaccharide 4'-kinase